MSHHPSSSCGRNRQTQLHQGSGWPRPQRLLRRYCTDMEKSNRTSVFENATSTLRRSCSPSSVPRKEAWPAYQKTILDYAPVFAADSAAADRRLFLRDSRTASRSSFSRVISSLEEQVLGEFPRGLLARRVEAALQRKQHLRRHS